MSSESQYIELYRECRNMIHQHSAPLMNALRDEAMADFEAQGFPSQKVERYKYTDVAKAFAPNYGVNLNRVNIPADTADVFRCDVPNLSTNLVFVVNDKPLTSTTKDGIYTGSLREFAQQNPEVLQGYYAQLASTKVDAINALNTALAQDGLLVYVPRNKRMEKTLQVVNLLRSGVDMLVNRRVLIILEDGAEATLLFCDHAMDQMHFLTTQVCEVFCGNNSHLDMYELEETHTSCRRFSNLYIKVGADCTVSHNNITLFNGETRNTTDVLLTGEHSEVTLNGCVVADKNQRVDNNTLIDHQVPHCTSNELFKYVVDDTAVGAFAGRILVRQDAQKTSSQETNANLCASPEARVYTQPMLEIYADDVKCSHGSTVGVLDQSALFYMQQRGIPMEEARMLLKFAFAGQVIDEVRLEPLRDRLHYLIEKRFRGELNKCTGCAMCK